ncbi:MAG: CapA family protein [Oscillospiraceae bacterium]|nr:CapA family protein [Oscillospiraceae bacterium]
MWYAPTGATRQATIKNDNQVQCARAAIDAGANIVVGHGPHRLQTAETYNGGVIFYSLGNFVFGGNTAPGDLDSAVAQVVIERATDGSLSVSGTRIYPCSISSRADGNDYRPTLYEPGTEEYDRAMSKIDGSWTGENQVIDYSFMHKE